MRWFREWISSICSASQRWRCRFYVSDFWIRNYRPGLSLKCRFTYTPLASLTIRRRSPLKSSKSNTIFLVTTEVFFDASILWCISVQWYMCTTPLVGNLSLFRSWLGIIEILVWDGLSTVRSIRSYMLDRRSSHFLLFQNHLKWLDRIYLALCVFSWLLLDIEVLTQLRCL